MNTLYIINIQYLMILTFIIPLPRLIYSPFILARKLNSTENRLNTEQAPLNIEANLILRFADLKLNHSALKNQIISKTD